MLRCATNNMQRLVLVCMTNQEDWRARRAARLRPPWLIDWLIVSVPLYLPDITKSCAQQFTGVHLRTSQSQLRNSSTSANHYEHFRSRMDFFRWFPNTSEDIRRFPKVSEDFTKILKNHKKHWKTLLNQSFAKTPEYFQTLPKIPEDHPKILKNHKNIWKTFLNHFQSFPKISEHSWRFSENFITILDCFRSFQKISEDCQSSSKISVNRLNSSKRGSKRVRTFYGDFRTLLKISRSFAKI